MRAPPTTVISRENGETSTTRLLRNLLASLEYWIARSSRAMTLSAWQAAIVAALFLTLAVPAFADVAVPQLTGRVVDQTGTLSSGDVAALSQKLGDFETR